MRLNGKKILVTGGSGFIGENLIKRLMADGIIIDNYDLSEGLDVTDKNKLTKVVKRKFDIIYHLAGFSGSAASNKDLKKSFEVNTFSTLNLCELLSRFSPKTKLILSSSRLEYGKPLYLPVDESHPTQPTSVYGLSKLAATQIALIYHYKNSLHVTIFRTSNVYGPHLKTKFSGYNIINHFIDLATENKNLTIFGRGNQERDYIYIDDLIDTFLKATSPISSGQIYNLGFGKGIKFKEMASLIIKKIGKGKIKFVKWPKDFEEVETGSYITDITKIKKDLGFCPKVDFEEGIERTIRLHK